jgi:nicotinate-nucleotide adenylyltransferase
MTKIAMLGGSFNPPHIGHLALADEVIHQLHYDTVLFVPTRIHPFKDKAPGASGRDRLEMLTLALSENSRFVIECCEMERVGTSYTYDTLCYLEQKYAGKLDGKIALVIGDDLCADFDKWYRFADITQRADIILARRPDGTGVGEFPYPHRRLDNALLPVSSSDIRARIAAGKSWRYLAVPRVSHYIMERKLYEYKSSDE